MTEVLWLPATALKPQSLAAIPKGSLVLRQPHGLPKPPVYGLRFDGDDRRWLLHLTDATEWSRFARADDITAADEVAFHVDLPFAIEFEASAKTMEWGYRDAPAGVLALGDEGPVLLAQVNRPASPIFSKPVSLSNWEWTSDQGLKAVLGPWRLRISLSATHSAWLSPPADSAAAKSWASG